MPNWKSPGEIFDINDTNAKIRLKNKVKVLNVAKLKHFFKNVEKSKNTEGDATQFNQTFNQSDNQAPTDFSDIFNQARNEGSITRAKAKLIKYKDAAQLALIQLKSETENINSLCRPSDHCAECESEDSYFVNRHSLHFQWRQLKLAEQCCKQWQLKLMKAEDRCHSTVPEHSASH